MSPAEAAYLRQYGPAKHARTGAIINTIFRINDRDCRFGECDEGDRCGRHERAVRVAERYQRLKERSR